MIKDYLTSELVETEVDVKTWRECIHFLGNKLVKAKKIEPDFIHSMIETVEELGPYMILLPGVAFFHGKPSNSVHEVCLSFMTCKEEVEFTDFDGQKIQCAFAFGALDSDSHMQMLMQVAKLLQDEEFLDLAKNHGSKELIMKKIAEY